MLESFNCWNDVLTYLGEHNNICYYHAPMDINPCIVTVTKRFKNGKLRIAVGPYSFTADKNHLDRFRYKVMA